MSEKLIEEFKKDRQAVIKELVAIKNQARDVDEQIESLTNQKKQLDSAFSARFGSMSYINNKLQGLGVDISTLDQAESPQAQPVEEKTEELGPETSPVEKPKKKKNTKKA